MDKLKENKNTIESLPAIAINIDILPKVFQERMAELAKESGKFQLRYYDDGMSMDIVDFSPKDNLGHDGLYGQLIYEHQTEDRIRVEIRAEAWKPEHPTKEIYSASVQHVFGDLIKAYNSRYKKRHRMRIIKVKSPSLPPMAARSLKDFISMANKNCLHPLDWERLYRLIKICHATRAKPPKELIRGLLSEEGFNDKNAEYVADIASHLLDFMKCKWTQPTV